MADVTGVDIEIDPELADLIPRLSEEELKGLEESLLRDGCIDPLRVWDHDEKLTLLDGHNRFEICQRHGIEFDTSTVEVAHRNDAMIWIIKNQFGRRNLSAYDRSALALKLKPMLAEKAKEKQVQGGKEKVPQISGKPLNTDDELAKIAGVSHDTINKAETISETGSEALKAAAQSGKVSINTAAIIAAALPKEAQDKVLEKSNPEIIKAAKAIKAEKKPAVYVDVETIEDIETDKRYSSIKEMLDKCGLKPDLTTPWTVKRNNRKHEVLVGWAGDDLYSALILVVVDYPMAVFQIPDNDRSKWWDWRTRLYCPPEGGSEGQPKPTIEASGEVAEDKAPPAEMRGGRIETNEIHWVASCGNRDSDCRDYGYTGFKSEDEARKDLIEHCEVCKGQEKGCWKHPIPDKPTHGMPDNQDILFPEEKVAAEGAA